jgi:hypothetical protein
MSTIYNAQTGAVLTSGLQSQVICDQTIIVARRIARELGQTVLVEDDEAGEYYQVSPRGRKAKVSQDDWEQAACFAALLEQINEGQNE